MSFESMMSAARVGAPVTIDAGWGQGRSSFGGLGAALLLAAMRAQAPANAPLRAISSSFVGPVVVGTARAAAEILRSGRSVTHTAARLYQDDQTQVLAYASFGADRPTVIDWDGSQDFTMPRPEDGRPVPQMPGVVPELIGNFDMIALDGAPPFSAQPRPDFSGLMRFKARTEPMTWEAVLAAIDAWPTGVMPMFPRPAPLSTMNWTVEFLSAELDPDPQAWWHFRVRTDRAAHGYAHQHAEFRDPAGRLFAISRQVVAIFV